MKLKLTELQIQAVNSELKLDFDVTKELTEDERDCLYSALGDYECCYAMDNEEYLVKDLGHHPKREVANRLYSILNNFDDLTEEL